MNTPRIETRRLLLRRFTEKDTGALYRLLKEEETNRFLPWFPLKTEAEAKNFYEKIILPHYETDDACYYAICLKEDTGNPVGYVKSSPDDSHDFGYALCRRLWRWGIVTEASKAVLAQLRKSDIPYITATHDVSNPHSGEVMKKIGMRYQYSYEEQWQPKNFPVIFRMYQLNFDRQKDRVYQKYWNLHPKHFIEREL